MEELEDTYAAVQEYRIHEDGNTEKVSGIGTGNVQVGRGKSLSTGESSVKIAASKQSVDGRGFVITLSSSIVRACDRALSDGTNHESKFPILKDNPPLKRFFRGFVDLTPLIPMNPRESDDADVGILDLMVPVSIGGETFDGVLSIGLDRSNWFWMYDGGIYVEYPISEEKIEILDQYVIPYGELNEESSTRWAEYWQYEFSEGEIEDNFQHIHKVYRHIES